jgi:hypothetical protein
MGRCLEEDETSRKGGSFQEMRDTTWRKGHNQERGRRNAEEFK